MTHCISNTILITQSCILLWWYLTYLLKGCDSATNYCLAFFSCVQQKILEIILQTVTLCGVNDTLVIDHQVGQSESYQTVSVDDNAKRGGRIHTTCIRRLCTVNSCFHLLLCLTQLLIYALFNILVNNEQCHIICKELARVSYVDSSFYTAK